MEELRRTLIDVGFQNIAVIDKQNSDEIIKSWKFGEGVEKMVVSVYIKATKPAA